MRELKMVGRNNVNQGNRTGSVIRKDNSKNKRCPAMRKRNRIKRLCRNWLAFYFLDVQEASADASFNGLSHR